MERLDKFLCDWGIGTRSQVKQILKTGAVTVDGKPEKDGSRKIEPGKNQICYQGQALESVGTVVVMLHKPEGYVTATEDKTEKTVMELLPEEYRHLDLKPVGRLDKMTTGLLLFTNDGDLLHRLISPKNQVQKIYIAHHEGQAAQEDINAFAEGMELRDGTKCLPAVLEPLGAGQSRITVCEGKYHQVRRMMAARGMHVEKLHRQKEGFLDLGDLPLGQTRMLTPEEIDFLIPNIL